VSPLWKIHKSGFYLLSLLWKDALSVIAPVFKDSVDFILGYIENLIMGWELFQFHKLGQPVVGT
jgi:hypothetical protein